MLEGGRRSVQLKHAHVNKQSLPKHCIQLPVSLCKMLKDTDVIILTEKNIDAEIFLNFSID